MALVSNLLFKPEICPSELDSSLFHPIPPNQSPAPVGCYFWGSGPNLHLLSPSHVLPALPTSNGRWVSAPALAPFCCLQWSSQIWPLHSLTKIHWYGGVLPPSFTSPQYLWCPLYSSSIGFSEFLKLATYLSLLGAPHALFPCLQCSFAHPYFIPQAKSYGSLRPHISCHFFREAVGTPPC